MVVRAVPTALLTMLRALLIVASLSCAAPDWVEISQNQYNRAPTRSPIHHQQEQTWPHPLHPARHPSSVHHDNDFRVGNVNRDREIYSNYSIIDHNWNPDVRRVPGGIKRVNTNFKRSNVTPEFSLDIYEQVTEIEPELATRYISKGVESVSATIERVPSKGSIKRVQLSHTPVKSPSVTGKISPIRRNDLKFYGSTDTDEYFSDEFELKSDISVTGQASQDHVKPFVSSAKKTPFTNYNRIRTSTKVPDTETAHGLSEKNDNKKDSVNIENIITGKEKLSLGTNIKKTTANVKPFGTIVANEYETLEDAPNFVTTTNNKPKENEEVTIRDHVDNSNANTNTRVLEKNNLKLKTDTSESKNDEDIKVNTMENIMKFIKVVAGTISENARKGVGGKVEYLNELKQTLLCTIKERIDATWPDDDGAGSARAQRRSRSAAARGHVEFPSSESALMTISFLTFAVFLIKLVLQVIHTYKNKAMMVAPLVVATAGRTVRKLRNFH